MNIPLKPNTPIAIKDVKKGFVQGALYEEDYLIKSLGQLAYNSEISLTELVANAWDAGATEVHLTLPDKQGEKIIIEDNGIGLTKDEFHERWMKLGYSRLKHQGTKVIFPKGVKGSRVAYGRNGIGRHGLLCFNSEYRVVTNSNGRMSTFLVTTRNHTDPFVISEEYFEKSKNYGTRLEVEVIRNLPNPQRILQIISARFLFDPSFKVYINKERVELEQLTGLFNSTTEKVDGITLQMHCVDTQKSARTTLYQGIAFWQDNRLVGEPSWILGRNAILDGRTKYAKRFSILVITNDLKDFVLPDWSDFIKSPVINRVYWAIEKYVNDVFAGIALEHLEETKESIREDLTEVYPSLSLLEKYEVNEVIESITQTHPTAKPETISIAVEALLNLEKTRKGKELLSKLAQLKDEDISGLNELLEKWTVKDALNVLDEIDHRISIIEAVKKLSHESNVDELHVLHPLVTQARWLFGPEFESSEYASNRQLQTAAEVVFKKHVGKEVFKNARKRPDIVVLENSTVSVTGTETYEDDSSLGRVNRVLILELKKGGFGLSRKEREQATGYVEDFLSCGIIPGSYKIESYVIGHSFSDKLQTVIDIGPGQANHSRIHICTYSQLIDTAQKRLFGLRNALNSRYDEMSGADLFSKVSIQLKTGLR